MDTLLGNDTYELQATYPLDKLHHRTIQLLYQPLVGYEAIAVYTSLWSEFDQISLTKAPCPFLRLTKITGMPLITIQGAVRKLEAIGLMRSYQKKEEQGKYLIELLLPLTPTDFFNHKVLNTLLYKTIGKEEYQRTAVAFYTARIDKDKYQEITASFSDVFTIDLLQDTKPILMTKESIQIKQNLLEKEYPLEVFYAGLADYQIKKNSITKDDEAVIQQLGMLYQVHALDMQRLVKESMVNDQLQHKQLLRSCREYYDLKMPETFKEVYHRQSVKHKHVSNGSSVDEHILYLENTTPFQLLKDKQGGKEPVKKDLMIVESILTTLQLEPGVVNVLIEMTLQQCDNSLPRGYIEYYGSTWKRKKITTVKEAIVEARECMKKKSDNVPSWHEQTVPSDIPKSNNNVGTELIDELLSEFGD